MIKRELNESGGGLESEVTMEQLSEQLSEEKSWRWQRIGRGNRGSGRKVGDESKRRE